MGLGGSHRDGMHRQARGAEGKGVPQAADETAALWARAIQDLAGFNRGLFYDVPLTARPYPLSVRSVRVRGGSAWRAFVDRRRRFDDGNFTIVISLRQLAEDEARLVVDWGSTYANTFLLVEPRDPGCDLTDLENPCRQQVENQAAALLRAKYPLDDEQQATRATPLGHLLRELFGRWTFWPAPGPGVRCEHVELALARPHETLAIRVRHEIEDRFPQAAFDRTMVDLYRWERELFGGPVPRIRSVFRTRLGLPILYDPACADHALRRMVNTGRVTVAIGPRQRRQSFGAGNPVPEAIPDEEFAQFEVL